MLFLTNIVMSFRSAVTIRLSIYLIAAKVSVILIAISVVLVMVSALILTVVAAVYKEGSIYFLARVFLLLYNN